MPLMLLNPMGESIGTQRANKKNTEQNMEIREQLTVQSFPMPKVQLGHRWKVDNIPVSILGFKLYCKYTGTGGGSALPG